MNVDSIFKEECSHLKFDKAFFKEFVDMEQSFVHKKPEHIEFFGGTMTGVQIVRFTDHEFSRFFGDVMMIDEDIVKQRVHELETINPEFKISSDIFNLSSVWLMHAVFKSKLMDDKMKEELMIRIALYLNYRFITSILYNFFKYPANPDTAAATYAQLSNRFILKAEGSWMAALRYRSEELTSKDSIWRETIEKMDDDIMVVKMLNDANGRIKSMVKNIYAVFMTVHSQGKKISSSSSFIEIDGEIKLRDKVKGLMPYTQYVKSVISRYDEFYKEELVEVILKVVNTASESIFISFMKWLCDNYAHFKDRKADLAVEMIMEHAFEYLSQHTNLLRQKEDIGTILIKIRGTYTSSRATEDKLLKIKEVVETLITQGTGTKNESSLAALRTAFCLYVVMRAFTMKHYQTK
jgi:hypothetical protein